MTSSSGTNVVPVALDRHEARQHLLRHLHARERLGRSPGRARARRGSATGWRCTGTGGRARRPAASAPGRSGAGSARRARRAARRRDVVAARRCGCRARPAPGAARCSRQPRLARRLLDGTASRMRVDRLARRAPVGARRVDAGVDLVVQAGDADHEELVEVRGVDREELHALEQRAARSSASCSTRSLKSSHESSRLKYELGSGRARARRPTVFGRGVRRSGRRDVSQRRPSALSRAT